MSQINLLSPLPGHVPTIARFSFLSILGAIVFLAYVSWGCGFRGQTPTDNRAESATGQNTSKNPQSPAESHAAQPEPIPTTFTNLQVLQKDIPQKELMAVMKTFCFTMDKRCSYCHMTNDDLSDADFVSDAKETKLKARETLRQKMTPK